LPLYEYIADDGAILELLRPMADADNPVEDPEGRGRTFRRKLSTFAAASSSDVRAGGVPLNQGCCPCGKAPGGCSRIG
jgi:hypothetical protein